MHGVRGFFGFAHIHGLIGADPAVYARLPRIHSDEWRTQGLDRLELIRFLQVAQTLTVHHGALAYLLGINALRLRSRGRPNRGLPRNASRTPGPALGRQRHQARHHADNTSRRSASWKPAAANEPRTLGTAPRFGEADRPPRRLSDDLAGREDRRHASACQSSLAAARCDHERTGCRCAAAGRPTWPGTPTPAPPSTTTVREATSTATASTSSPPTSPASDLRPSRREGRAMRTRDPRFQARAPMAIPEAASPRARHRYSCLSSHDSRSSGSREAIPGVHGLGVVPGVQTSRR